METLPVSSFETVLPVGSGLVDPPSSALSRWKMSTGQHVFSQLLSDGVVATEAAKRNHDCWQPNHGTMVFGVPSWGIPFGKHSHTSTAELLSWPFVSLLLPGWVGFGLHCIHLFIQESLSQSLSLTQCDLRLLNVQLSNLAKDPALV